MLNLNVYVWVANGTRRQALIKAMSHPMTPSELRKQVLRFNGKMSLNNTCDVLREFVVKGLTICLNPDVRKGRKYALTPVGEDIRKCVFNAGLVL